MRTSVVPAQITTVEDRIAGNLTFIQIVLLIVPLFIGTAVYIFVPQRMHIGILKGVIIGFEFLIFSGLAIRFRGRILADWLLTYIRFKMRPRKYVFTKYDLAARDIVDAVTKKEPAAKNTEEKPVTTKHSFAFSDFIKINKLFENPKMSVSLKMAKKGGVDVSFKTLKD